METQTNRGFHNSSTTSPTSTFSSFLLPPWWWDRARGGLTRFNVCSRALRRCCALESWPLESPPPPDFRINQPCPPTCAAPLPPLPPSTGSTHGTDREGDGETKEKRSGLFYCRLNKWRLVYLLSRASIRSQFANLFANNKLIGWRIPESFFSTSISLSLSLSVLFNAKIFLFLNFLIIFKLGSFYI